MNILKKDKKKIIADFAPGQKVSTLHELMICKRPPTFQSFKENYLIMAETCFCIISLSFFTKAINISMQDVGIANIEKLEAALPTLADVVATEDKNEILYKQQELLEYVGIIEESMLKEFPFEIPPEYNDLPQLKVELNLSQQSI